MVFYVIQKVIKSIRSIESCMHPSLHGTNQMCNLITDSLLKSDLYVEYKMFTILIQKLNFLNFLSSRSPLPV